MVATDPVAAFPDKSRNDNIRRQASANSTLMPGSLSKLPGGKGRIMHPLAGHCRGQHNGRFQTLRLRELPKTTIDPTKSPKGGVLTLWQARYIGRSPRTIWCPLAPPYSFILSIPLCPIQLIDELLDLVEAKAAAGVSRCARLFAISEEIVCSRTQ